MLNIEDMCLKISNIKEQHHIDKEIFKNIFREHWNSFKKKYGRYNNSYHDLIIEKMLNCGDVSSGYSLYVCSHCGLSEKKVAFSCKSNFCLSCGKVYSDNWSSHLAEILHPGLSYRHVVLTVPKALRKYFYRNPDLLLGDLMKLGRTCLEELLKTVKKQDLNGGYIVVLHTSGRDGTYNPHLHIIMTDGGINENSGKWCSLGYFPYKILHKKWQYYLLKKLKELLNTEEVKEDVNKMWKKYKKPGFVVQIDKGRVPKDCEQLSKYLGKYLVSPPISIRRLLKYDGSKVTYWYESHKTKQKEVVTVDVLTFIGRMVQHILPKGFKRIRYYGLQATKTFEKLKDIVFNALKSIGRVVKGFFRKVKRKNYRERYSEISKKDPFLCSVCGGEMLLWQIWHPRSGIIYDEKEKMKKRAIYIELNEELEKMKRYEYEQRMGIDSRRRRDDGGSGFLQLSLPFMWI